jgi:hypothetical protein
VPTHGAVGQVDDRAGDGVERTGVDSSVDAARHAPKLGFERRVARLDPLSQVAARVGVE